MVEEIPYRGLMRQKLAECLPFWRAGNVVTSALANQRVFATLIGEPTIPFVERSTTVTGVPLEPNGDFRIDDSVNPATSDCHCPVLLIRSSGNGAWFAAGISKLGDDG